MSVDSCFGARQANNTEVLFVYEMHDDLALKSLEEYGRRYGARNQINKYIILICIYN